jgi:DNA polymerase I-like protein with 3'-5' exonuclease and polymerase domains
MLNISDGAYPPKVAKSIGCSIEEAQKIYDNYHNVLYPGVTNFRENYVHKTVREKGSLHLNWGLRLYSDDADADIRTCNNACMQSFSVLTQIAAVELDKVILQEGMEDKVTLVNLIHDAIYLECDDDIDTIDWVNRNLAGIMTRKFLKNQELDLLAEVDIGYNLYDVITLPNNCSKEQIQELKSKLSRG